MWMNSYRRSDGVIFKEYGFTSFDAAKLHLIASIVAEIEEPATIQGIEESKENKFGTVVVGVIWGTYGERAILGVVRKIRPIDLGEVVSFSKVSLVNLIEAALKKGEG